jgi:hypothetical protein
MSALNLMPRCGPDDAAQTAAARAIGAGGRDGCAATAGAPLAAAGGGAMGAVGQQLKRAHVWECETALGALAAGGAARGGARRAGRHDSAASLHASPSAVSPPTTDDEAKEDALLRSARNQRLRAYAAASSSPMRSARTQQRLRTYASSSSSPTGGPPRIIARALSVKVSALPASFEVFAPQLTAIVEAAVREHGAALAGAEPAAVQARVCCSCARSRAARCARAASPPLLLRFQRPSRHWISP